MSDTLAYGTCLAPEHLDYFLDGVVDEGDAADHGHRRDLVRAGADAWRQAGLRPGDLVLLGLSNSRAMLAQLFAVIAAGGVPAVVPPSMPSARLALLTRLFGARAIALRRLPALDGVDVEAIRDIDGQVVTAWIHRPGPSLTTAGEVVLSTTGTSGVASACVHSIDALLRNAAKHADAVALGSDDVVLVTLPLYFSYALVAQALAALVRSARLVLSAPPFQPRVYQRNVRARGITMSSLTPALVQMLLSEELSVGAVLRALTVGGDTLPPTAARNWLRLHPDGELYVTYGLTEAGPRVATLAVHGEPPSRWGSVGRPLPATQVSLTGDGEVLIASDTLMRRRIGAVEGHKLHEWRGDGVLATGDIGALDQDGYLYLHGRLSEFILVGGEKVFLGSVRRLTSALPGVVRAEIRREGSDVAARTYELVLHVQPEAEPATLRREVARLLRSPERPSAVHIIPAPVGALSSYK